MLIWNGRSWSAPVFGAPAQVYGVTAQVCVVTAREPVLVRLYGVFTGTSLAYVPWGAGTLLAEPGGAVGST